MQGRGWTGCKVCGTTGKIEANCGACSLHVRCTQRHVPAKCVRFGVERVQSRREYMQDRGESAIAVCKIEVGAACTVLRMPDDRGRRYVA